MFQQENPSKSAKNFSAHGHSIDEFEFFRRVVNRLTRDNSKWDFIRREVFLCL